MSKEHDCDEGDLDMKCAFIIIDMQNAVKEEGLYESQKTIQCIQELAMEARKNNVEVLYVRHIEKGDQNFDITAYGSQIIQELAPLEGEKVILKSYNSSFKETELEAYLQSKSIDTLILTGAMTEYCFDTSVRVAFEKGYRIYIPEHGHTTSDSTLSKEAKYHFFTTLFANCFGQVVPKEALKQMLGEMAEN